MTQEIAIYFDASRCTACKGCQINCKQWNQLPSKYVQDDTPFSGTFENPTSNDGDTWLHMRFQEGHDSNNNWFWAFGRNACQHCTDAACVDACPTGACHYLENGSVVIDKEKCIACEYCVAACPFDVPFYNSRSNIDAVRKCWLCQDRIANDKEPACVSTCPTDALQFGPRDEMIEKAHARLKVVKETKPDAIIYGEHEMGGLHVIQVLPYGAKAAGLPENPKRNVWTTATDLMKPLTGIGVAGVLALTVVSFIGGRGTQRGNEDIQFDTTTGVTTNLGEFYDSRDMTEVTPDEEGGSNG